VGRGSVAAISFALSWPVLLAEGALLVARMIPGKFLAVLLGHGAGRWRSVCAQGLLVLLFTIVPLAEASPPDPLWVGGTFDGADLDDVVAAVIAATAVVTRTVFLPLDPTVIEAVLLAKRAYLPTFSPPARPVRAPPSFGRSAAA